MTPYPFQPRGGGLSTNQAVTAASVAVTLPTGTTSLDGGVTGRFVNSGTQDIFLTFDGTAATTTAGMRMLANTVEMFTIPAGASMFVIAASTGSTLCLSLGDGQ